MAYKFINEYTPEVEDKDYIVFLKTNFQTPVLNAKGNVVRWEQDADNYVYGLFPNRKMNKTGMMLEGYVKPEGDITTWADKLPKTDTMEIDALSEDLPASEAEFSDLLAKLVADHTVDDGVIVIKDATTWQKLRAARKRILRKQLDDIINWDGDEGLNDPDAPIIDPYPLVGIS